MVQNKFSHQLAKIAAKGGKNAQHVNKQDQLYEANIRNGQGD